MQAPSPPPQAKAAEARQKYSDAIVQQLPAGAIFVGISRDAGRNAQVTLYPNRVERVKAKSFGAMSRANQDHEVTPIKAISSVQAKKDGHRTKVIVYASGNEIEFRFSHREAVQFREHLMRLMLTDHPPAHLAPPAPPPPHSTVSPADQVREFAKLRDEGLISPEEFDAKRREILGL